MYFGLCICKQFCGLSYLKSYQFAMRFFQNENIYLLKEQKDVTKCNFVNQPEWKLHNRLYPTYVPICIVELCWYGYLCSRLHRGPHGLWSCGITAPMANATMERACRHTGAGGARWCPLFGGGRWYRWDADTFACPMWLFAPLALGPWLATSAFIR